MKFSQRKIKLFTRLMLVAGLFAQGTLAAHACVTSVDSAAMVHANESVTEAMPCHKVEKTNANACLMHCTQDSQVNLDQHSIAVLPVTENVLFVEMPEVQYSHVTISHTTEALNTGPPLSIRYCSFLI
jgi:hypothetical protein